MNPPIAKLIFDISPALSPSTAVWPGDVRLSRELQLRLEEGASVELSTIHSTVHIGAHADAPSHFEQSAPSIDQLHLSAYFGRCRVVTVEGRRLIGAEDLRGLVDRGDERILVKTNSFPDPNHFNEDFSSFHPSAIDLLADLGIQLLGIDTPSIDPFDSKDLPTHHRLFKRGLRNLEGLDLARVPDGIYGISALPLKLSGFDASPVRAILVQY